MTSGIIFRKYNSTLLPSEVVRADTAQFLHLALDKYGDSRELISKSIDYALDSSDEKGGFIMCAFIEGKIVGAAVINHTGMSGYIPENILVYIAIDKKERGKGIGTDLLHRLVDNVDGDIALHVDKDNPAIELYERFGFERKFIEMRYARK